MPITNDTDTLRSVLWKMNQLEGAMVRKRRGADMVQYPKLWTDLHKWLSEQIPAGTEPAAEYTRPMLNRRARHCCTHRWNERPSSMAQRCDCVCHR